MQETFHINWLIPISLLAGILSLAYFIMFVRRLKKRRLLAAGRKLFGFSLFFLATAISAFLLFSFIGYQQLTSEQKVATISIQPNGNQRFIAQVLFENGERKTYPLYGDQLQLDAYIVKWKPWVTLLGMHAGFRLDRISGRYQQVATESVERRQAYPLSSSSRLDIALWRGRYQILAWAVDVEHGSASFVDASEARKYTLMVTQDALLLRPETRH